MNARGFSLLEVVIALAILAMSLTVLLQTQMASIANAGRSRDLSIATMLARGKMIDIEQKLFHDGFSANTESDSGTFSDEGYPEISWKSQVVEIELNMNALGSLCDSFGDKVGDTVGKGKGGDKAAGGSDCQSMLGSMGTIIGGFTDDLAHAMRLLELKLSWPMGKHTGTMGVRALLTRDDFGTQQESDLNRNVNQNLGNSGAANQGLGVGGALNNAGAAGH